MSKNIHEASFRPFLRHIFWPMLVSMIILVVVANIIIYTVSTQQMMISKQRSLENIAATVASKIPFAIHQSLINPEQQNGADYRLIEKYFQDVMDGNPEIDDIYTLRPTGKLHEYSFVVSGMVTHDKNGNGIIEDNEQKPSLGEKYDTINQPDLEAGLTNTTHDRVPTYDKWGAWLSGYSPLRDEHGQGTAVVGVDYSVAVFSDYRMDIIKALLYLDLSFIIIGTLLIYLMSLYFTRPFRHIAHGLNRVARGDLDYRLPLAKGDEGMFNEQFNGMLTMIENTLANKNKENSGDFSKIFDAEDDKKE